MSQKAKYTLLAAVVTVVVLWIVAPEWGRAISGFVFVLLVPGFSLVYLLFPGKDLDIVEKLALSFGLSICVVVLDGVVLDKIWEVSLVPVVVSLLLFTLVCFFLGALWRLRT